MWRANWKSQPSHHEALTSTALLNHLRYVGSSFLLDLVMCKMAHASKILTFYSQRSSSVHKILTLTFLAAKSMKNIIHSCTPICQHVHYYDVHMWQFSLFLHSMGSRGSRQFSPYVSIPRKNYSLPPSWRLFFVEESTQNEDGGKVPVHPVVGSTRCPFPFSSWPIYKFLSQRRAHKEQCDNQSWLESQIPWSSLPFLLCSSYFYSLTFLQFTISSSRAPSSRIRSALLHWAHSFNHMWRHFDWRFLFSMTSSVHRKNILSRLSPFQPLFLPLPKKREKTSRLAQSGREESSVNCSSCNSHFPDHRTLFCLRSGLATASPVYQWKGKLVKVEEHVAILWA